MSLIRKLLFEVKRKETLDYINDLLEFDQGDHFLSFSNLNKVGINPIPFYPRTPLGIYAYRLIDVKTQYGGDLRKLPYGKDRKYILILKRKPSAKLLYLSKISKKEFDKLQEVLDKEFGINLMKPVKNFSAKNFFEIIKNYSEKIEPNRPYLIQYKLLRKMGYDIVVDDGTGSIHPNEPFQVVILNPESIEHIKTLYNPYFQNEPFSLSKRNVNDKNNLLENILFVILRNKFDLNTHTNVDKLIFFTKQIDKQINTKNLEAFLKEITHYLEKIYTLAKNENNIYNPLKAIFVILPYFKEEIEKLAKENNIGDKNLNLNYIMEKILNYLYKRNLFLLLYYINDIKDTNKNIENFIPLILQNIFKQENLLDRKTIKLLANFLYKRINTMDYSYYLPASIIFIFSNEEKYKEFAYELLEELYYEKGHLLFFILENMKNKLFVKTNKINLKKILEQIDNFMKEIIYVSSSIYSDEYIEFLKNKIYEHFKIILSKEDINKIITNYINHEKE